MTELQYEPNPGSVAARVLAYLRGKPAGYGASNAELSHALGAPAASMNGCLNLAVNAKLIHRRTSDAVAGGRETVWVLGPPRQAALASETKTAVTGPGEPDPIVAQIKELWPEAPMEKTPAGDGGGEVAAEPDDDAFACALFNDGRLYLEVGDERLTLQAGQTRELMRYLDRIAVPEEVGR